MTGASVSAQTTGQSSQELELPDTEAPRTGSVDIRIDTDVSAAADCPFGASDLTVELSGLAFVLANGEPLPPELSAAVSSINPPTGPLPLATVCDLRDQANAALRQGGWIASVSLPPQNIEDTLLLKVTLGSLNSVTINGDPGPYQDMLEGLAARIGAMVALNERAIERELLIASDIPGLRVGLSLSPSPAGAGQIDGTLNVSFDRYAAFFNTRNLNARATGRETIFGRVELYGLTGLSDATFFGAQTTLDFEEQFVLQAGHEFGVGSDNIRIGAELLYAESRPSVGALDIRTDTFVTNVYASYPLVRSPGQSLDLTLGFDLADQSTDLGAVTLSRDATRSLYLRFDIDGQSRRRDRSTSLLYRGFAELRQGISVFDATEQGASGFAETDGFLASRPFGDATATVVRFGGDVTWLIDPVFSVRSRVEGQWTDDPLLSFDEFAIGNLSIGRGYDPGANSGDRAFGAQFEIGANLLSDDRSRLQIFGFYDVVTVENLDPGTIDRSRTLSSLGGGLRYFLTRGLSAEVTYAVPLDPALFQDNDEPPSRLLFSITTQFPAVTR